MPGFSGLGGGTSYKIPRKSGEEGRKPAEKEKISVKN
jgi:hypothetical protein